MKIITVVISQHMYISVHSIKVFYTSKSDCTPPIVMTCNTTAT